MAFKCIRTLAPPYLCKKFKQCNKVNDCNTRNKKSLEVPLYKTAAGQHSFSYRATHIWNNNYLPDDLKDNNLSFIQFKAFKC